VAKERKEKVEQAKKEVKKRDNPQIGPQIPTEV